MKVVGCVVACREFRRYRCRMALAQVHVERGQRAVGMRRRNTVNVERRQNDIAGFAVNCDVRRRRRRRPGRRCTDSNLKEINQF